MTLTPGWYIARVRLPSSAAADGLLCPWLSMGDGPSRPLGYWLPGDEIEVTVSIEEDEGVPRVLPSAEAAAAITPDLIPISRVGALLSMLAGAPRSMTRRTLRDTWCGVVLALRGALTGGPRRAMYLVAARYQHSLRFIPSPLDDHGPGCSLSTGLLSLPVEARWMAHNQLVPGAHEPGSWEAVGDDPHFVLRNQDSALPLPAGWYRVQLELIAEEGRLVSPALYPDYGNGMREYDAIRLPEPDQNNRIDALVLLKSSVAALRFDPSVRPVKFHLANSSIKRVGRLGALIRMLDRGRRNDGSRDWRASLENLGRFCRDACTHGLSDAASHLYNGYHIGDEHDYPRWVLLYDTLPPRDIESFRSRVEVLQHRPLVSILVPVYDTPDKWLRRCLDSVLAQVYPNWELCVVDDASPSPRVRQTLAEYSKRDARIRVLYRDKNGHISAASNDALQMARGDMIGLLDHDDELRPHALLEMIEALEANPGAGLLYSDEDKIDERGRRFQPNFKPDWNPDLLLSQNYICHFTMIRTDVARAAGGFRVGYEGSQDHDLFLRCTERLEPSEIVHVPRVLYHWRAIAGSTALERDAKDYATRAGVRAVRDYLGRNAPPGAKAAELAHGHYRVHWPLPNPPPRVSIIVPTRDRVDLLRTCIRSLYAKTQYPSFEVLIVDNQSEQPETREFFAELEASGQARILRFDEAFNYSAINNMAARAAAGDILCLLNNDIEVVEAGWLGELVSHAVRPKIGAVGPMLYFPDRTIQHAGVILGLGGVANHIYSGQPEGFPGHGGRALVAQNMSAVTGACLVVERKKYLAVGGMEEELSVAFNDVDFCLRLQSGGYNNVWTPFAQLLHHESASRGKEDTEEKRSRFVGEVRLMEARWADMLVSDPSYNPNLSLSSQMAGFSFPPRQARYERA